MNDNTKFSRRSVLMGTAASLTAAVAGCSESTDDTDYESGNGNGNDSENSSSNDQEVAEITEHEMVSQETDYGTSELVVKGTVKNNSEDLVNYVEVSVRAYNADDQQIDSYMNNTTDLAGGTEWPFEVSLYDLSESDVESYDISLEADQY